MFPSVLQLNSEAEDGDGGWRVEEKDQVMLWKWIFATRKGSMSQDMKQKVVRKETPREVGLRAGKKSQGCLTDSLLLRETSERKGSLH